jgi:hypothetical protein
MPYLQGEEPRAYFRKVKTDRPLYRLPQHVADGGELEMSTWSICQVTGTTNANWCGYSMVIGGKIYRFWFPSSESLEHFKNAL